MYALLSAATLAGAWGFSYWTGGSRTAAPHAFYVGIVLAAVGLRASGAIVAGLAAGILAGPLLPLSVIEQTAQPLANWLSRLGFFLFIGLTIALAVSRLRANWLRSLEMRDREEELTRSKAAIIGSVSHEFRTPLTVIEAALHTLGARDLTTSEGRPLVEAAERASQRLWNLTSVVLSVAEALDSAEQRGLTESRVLVERVVEEITFSLNHRGARQRLEVRVVETGRYVITNEALFKSMLFALVDNALKFSPTDEPVVVDVERDVDDVIVRVIDRGPGIPDGRLDDARRAFSREVGDRAQEGAGIGLGLFSAERIAASLGGALRIESTPEGSCAVVVRLPQRRLADDAELGRQSA